MMFGGPMFGVTSYGRELAREVLRTIRHSSNFQECALMAGSVTLMSLSCLTFCFLTSFLRLNKVYFAELECSESILLESLLSEPKIHTFLLSYTIVSISSKGLFL